jgi:Arc/MetJ family transcription regulator
MSKPNMRTTLNIDDDLYTQAVELTGVHEKTALVREGLHALIERESAKRLALLGGSEPDLMSIPRRQSNIAKE